MGYRVRYTGYPSTQVMIFHLALYGIGALLAQFATKPFLLWVFPALFLAGISINRAAWNRILAASWLVTIGILVSMSNHHLVAAAMFDSSSFPPVKVGDPPEEWTVQFIVLPLIVFSILGVGVAFLRRLWIRIPCLILLTFGGLIWAGQMMAIYEKAQRGLYSF